MIEMSGYTQSPVDGIYTTIGQKNLYRFDISVKVLEFLELREIFFTEVKCKKRFPQNKNAFDNLCSCFYGIVDKVKPILLYKPDKKTADTESIEIIEAVEAFFI